MSILKWKKITPENFRKFGQVVTAPTTKPSSESAEYRFWSDLANYQILGETEIGICTVYRQPIAQISGLERHLRTPEILLPIDAPFVLPLLGPGDTVEQMEAFLVQVGETVVINEGIWHGACLPFGMNDSSYFVIFRRRTPLEDVEKKMIPEVTILC